MIIKTAVSETSLLEFIKTSLTRLISALSVREIIATFRRRRREYLSPLKGEMSAPQADRGVCYPAAIISFQKIAHSNGILAQEKGDFLRLEQLQFMRE